ncbi:MAG: hypothetical protein P1U68_13500 [Verrucomicrobiales bacterium]|nr:hypothetical protein [Verrucomicrobiales bacterium]
MNNHKSACLLILMLITGMLYGVNQLRNATNTARDLSNEARIEAETAEQQAQLAQIQLKSLESKTAELRSAFTKWEPHFANYSTPQDAEQRIAEVIRDGDVFLLSQKFEAREVEKDALISEALIADLIVEDEYSKTLNWLGRLEEAIPSCRISRCNIKRGERGNDIHLELRVEIPVLNK